MKSQIAAARAAAALADCSRDSMQPEDVEARARAADIAAVALAGMYNLEAARAAAAARNSAWFAWRVHAAIVQRRAAGLPPG